MKQKQKHPTTVWRTAGGDTTRRGLFPRQLKLRADSVATLTAGGPLQAPVVFSSAGHAFVCDMRGLVQAADREGKKLWERRLDGGVSAAPVLDPSEKILYAGTWKGEVAALDAATGSVLFSKRIPSTSDPRILSDLLYVHASKEVVLNSWGGKWRALDALTGKEAGSWDAGITPHAGAAADRGGAIYLLRTVWKKGTEAVKIDSGGRAAVLHTEKNRKLPEKRLVVSAEPVIDPRRTRLYFITHDGTWSHLHALSLKTGAHLWKHRMEGFLYATPTLRPDGSVVTCGLNGIVEAVSPENKCIYRYRSGCDYLLSGAVCDAGGAVYAGDPLGRIHRIDPDGTGAVFFETPRSIQARPSIDPEGRLFVPATDGRVYIFSSGGQ